MVLPLVKADYGFTEFCFVLLSQHLRMVEKDENVAFHVSLSENDEAVTMPELYPQQTCVRAGDVVGGDVPLKHMFQHRLLDLKTTLCKGSRVPRVGTISLGLPLRKPMSPQKIKRNLRMLAIAAAQRQHRLPSTPPSL